MKIVFLVSGNGGNLKFIKKVIDLNLLDAKVSVIAVKKCGALEFARNNKIDNYKIKYNQKNTKELYSLLEKLNPDYIITTFNKIIDEELVNKYSQKMINLHYSLLPSFGGLVGVKPIDEALNKKCKFLGATLHYVEKEVDAGEIIAQAVIFNKYDRNEVIERVFRAGCLILLNFLIGDDKKELYSHCEMNFNPPLTTRILDLSEDIWEYVKRS